MKLDPYFLTLFGCSLAILPPEQFKGKNVYIEPINSNSNDVALDGRIIGGDEVEPNSVPYQVAVLVQGTNVCGGSLISANYVLTAAHCTVEASFVVLIFGAHSIQNSTEPSQVRMTSSNLISHPEYSSTTLNNDIALVKLPSSIKTNSNIQIIPLAPSTSGTYADSIAFLTGWGLTADLSSVIPPFLKGVTLTVISNEVCAISYGTSIVVDQVLCTSGIGTIGACIGDSGGPLVVDGVQVGVVSFVAGYGCEREYPTGYARVSEFRDWIAENSDVPL